MTTEINIKDKQAIIATLDDILLRAKHTNFDSEAVEVFVSSIKTLIILLKETK